MNANAAQPAVKYIAEINDAHEATLVGSADLDYWRRHLVERRLHPTSRHGRAEVVISAVALRWLGFRFNELSVAVSVCEQANGATRDGYYLVSAFNTSRLLAWCERTMFRTPYVHAQVEVQARPQCSLKLIDNQGPVLSAERRSAAPAEQNTEDTWEVPIYLPSAAAGEVFYARLGGVTEVYPFDPNLDVVRLAPTSRHAVVRQLVDTKFVGTQWRVRPHAHHARSKTYRREL